MFYFSVGRRQTRVWMYIVVMLFCNMYLCLLGIKYQSTNNQSTIMDPTELWPLILLEGKRILPIISPNFRHSAKTYSYSIILPRLQRLWPMTSWRISKMDVPEVISIVLHRSCSKHPIQWWCFQMSTQGQRPSRRTGGGFIKSGVRIKALQLVSADYPLLPVASSFATKMRDVFIIDT